MLQQDEPDDFVIATGETNTVRRCVEVAFDQAGIPWEDHVVIDDAFKRPAEVDLLVGDYGKAERQLGWKPATDFDELIRLMVDADLKPCSRRLVETSPVYEDREGVPFADMTGVRS